MKEFTLTTDNFDDCVDAATGQPIPREGNVVLPERVIFQGEEYLLTNIGDWTFSDCNGLTSIDIPNSVTTIGNLVFQDCTNLVSCKIPGSVQYMGHGIFEDCVKLENVNLENGVKVIESSAFIGCKNLKTIHIPDSMELISDCAFQNSGIIELTLPDKVSVIGCVAFNGCEDLKKIHIPGAALISNDIFFGCSDDLVINYRGSDITQKAFTLVQEQSDGFEDQKCLGIAKKAADILGKDVYSPVLVSKLCNAEHGGKLEQTVTQIKENFQTIGFYDIKNSADIKAKEELTALFQADKRSRGVVPKIIDALTIASTELHIQPEQIVKSFEEKKFRDAVMAMRSCNKGNRFCDVEAALFAMNFDVNTVKNVILENPNKDYASVLLCESYKKNDRHLLDLSKWVTCHPDVSQDLVKDVVKYRNSITLDVSDNVDAVRAQISRGQAMLEIQEIEKEYPDFKFADCKCNLPKTEVELGNYKAYIMDAQDPRQVMIGYDTDCCQHLGGAGETAMMYGLANPDAGFFVIEDKKSGKILAQAETWQTADGEKLVFDNIEFVDDRQISQFAPVIAKWCEESPYPDILMGNGYNEMVNNSIRTSDGITPPMTDELQKIFDGREDDKDYDDDYDYDENDEDGPYTDADESCSVLKSNDVVEPYFQDAYDSYVQEHGELPDIGSFFSEPSEEDLLAFSRDETSPEDTFVMVSGDHLEDLENEHEATAPEVAGRCEDMAAARDDYDDIDERF